MLMLACRKRTFCSVEIFKDLYRFDTKRPIVKMNDIVNNKRKVTVL